MPTLILYLPHTMHVHTWKHNVHVPTTAIHYLLYLLVHTQGSANLQLVVLVAPAYLWGCHHPPCGIVLQVGVDRKGVTT